MLIVFSNPALQMLVIARYLSASGALHLNTLRCIYFAVQKSFVYTLRLALKKTITQLGGVYFFHFTKWKWQNKSGHYDYSFLQSCVTNTRNSSLLLCFVPGLEKTIAHTGLIYFSLFIKWYEVVKLRIYSCC